MRHQPFLWFLDFRNEIDECALNGAAVKAITSSKGLRIPVRIVDGRMEFAFGGGVPLREGASAELTVHQNDIAEKEFLKALTQPGRHLVLSQGTKLLVGLSVRDRTNLTLFENSLLIELAVWPEGPIVLADCYPGTSYFTNFVEIELAGPTNKQLKCYGSDKGGLWLLTKGRQARGLSSTTVKLPVEISKKPVASLNHALTLLSEKFETWRISHSGNVYEQVFYKEKNGRWCALDYLRNEKVEKAEMQIAHELWNDFLEKMRR